MTGLRDFLISQREDSTSMPGLSRYSTPSMSNLTYVSECGSFYVDNSEVEPSPRGKINNFISKAREDYPLLAEGDDTIIDDNDGEEDEEEEIVLVQPKRSSTTTDLLRSEILIEKLAQY